MVMIIWNKKDILYEDRQILVCRKHAGMAVQSARIGQMDMESSLRNYLKGGYIGIIQRLDQPVEGVLVFAKTQKAAADLPILRNVSRPGASPARTMQPGEKTTHTVAVPRIILRRSLAETIPIMKTAKPAEPRDAL